MKRPLVSLLAGVILAAPLPSLADPLHNSGKTFTAPSQMRASDWTDPSEIRRTWDAALVRIPTGAGQSRKLTTAQLARAASPSDKRPTIIYLHGCSGFWNGTHKRVKLFADNGFVTIAPASFARKKYPRSCDETAHRGGLYRKTLTMRQNDAGFAIEMARKMPLVDPDRIFLVGLSQGAVATATFKARNSRQRVRARIIEGWTCHSGWPEYHGVNAARNEPVMALVGQRDPWFQNDWTRGDCGAFLNPANGSQSIVYTSGHLARTHALLDFNRPRQQVLTFLRQHLE